MISFPSQIVHTLKYLGHTTSINLQFSYHPQVPISYGEETITETNLLELFRHHSNEVRIIKFTRHRESKVGADWEWHILGRKKVLRMRIQAKRIQRNNVLKIHHTVGKSGMEQRDLLLQAAKINNMRPMYCIYCTESQRNLWKKRGFFQTGCLLADANDVPLHTRDLRSIEKQCWPWHYLFEDNCQPHKWNGPTILDLNEDTERIDNDTGVMCITPEYYESLTADDIDDEPKVDEYDLLERRHTIRARHIVMIDVRNFKSD